MKALVGTFNQEKALVGALSVIVKTGCGTDGALHSTGPELALALALALVPGNRQPVGPVPAKPPGRGELGCSVHGMGVTSSDS